jgi:predicted nucleic acid-binding protein
VNRGLYVETSALLRVVLEADEALRPQLLRESCFTSALTFAEAARAVIRARRQGRLDAPAALEASRRFAEFGRSCGIVPVDQAVLERAARQYPVEPVRTLDAIHLATVLLLSGAAIALDVASCDRRIRDNAKQLGFAVVPPMS